MVYLILHFCAALLTIVTMGINQMSLSQYFHSWKEVIDSANSQRDRLFLTNFSFHLKVFKILPKHFDKLFCTSKTKPF